MNNFISNLLTTLVSKPLISRACIHGPNIRTEKPNPKKPSPITLHRSTELLTLHFTLQNQHSVTAQSRAKQNSYRRRNGSNGINDKENRNLRRLRQSSRNSTRRFRVTGIPPPPSLPQTLHRNLRRRRAFPDRTLRRESHETPRFDFGFYG